MRDFEALLSGDKAGATRTLEEARIDRRLAEGRAQVAAGKAILADGVFFEQMRKKILKAVAYDLPG